MPLKAPGCITGWSHTHRKKLDEVSQRLYQTEKKIEDTQLRLQATNNKKLKQETELKHATSRAAQQLLQALYSAGEESHLRCCYVRMTHPDISCTMRYLSTWIKAGSNASSLFKSLSGIADATHRYRHMTSYLQNLWANPSLVAKSDLADISRAREQLLECDYVFHLGEMRPCRWGGLWCRQLWTNQGHSGNSQGEPGA